MPRPICTKCTKFLRPERNGITVEVLDSNGDPYQLWSADLWKCPACETQTITGYGHKPIAERGNGNYFGHRRLAADEDKLYSVPNNW